MGFCKCLLHIWVSANVFFSGFVQSLLIVFLWILANFCISLDSSQLNICLHFSTLPYQIQLHRLANYNSVFVWIVVNFFAICSFITLANYNSVFFCPIQFDSYCIFVHRSQYCLNQFHGLHRIANKHTRTNARVSY